MKKNDTKSAASLVRVVPGKLIEIPLPLLRHEFGLFLCGWGTLVGFRCLQVMNLTHITIKGRDWSLAFRILDQHIVFFRHAGVMTNWLVFSTGLCLASFAGRILGKSNLEVAPYSRWLPLFFILILVLKNRALG